MAWCCLSKGETKFTISREKSGFVAGETTHVKIEIDNARCSLAM